MIESKKIEEYIQEYARLNAVSLSELKRKLRALCPPVPECSANAWISVPGYERAPENLQPKTCGIVLAGMGDRRVPWVLSVPSKYSHLVLKQGQISPAGLFFLGFACLWKSFLSTIKQANRHR